MKPAGFSAISALMVGLALASSPASANPARDAGASGEGLGRRLVSNSDIRTPLQRDVQFNDICKTTTKCLPPPKKDCRERCTDNLFKLAQITIGRELGCLGFIGRDCLVSQDRQGQIVAGPDMLVPDYLPAGEPIGVTTPHFWNYGPLIANRSGALSWQGASASFDIRTTAPWTGYAAVHLLPFQNRGAGMVRYR